MPNHQTDILIYIIIGIFLVILSVALILFFVDFFHKLRYLNKEIQCTYGAERAQWIRRRRRLWLSLLPFVKY